MRISRCLRQGDRLERADEKYSHSELLLYKNLALSDAGMTKEALDHLEACRDKVFTIVMSVECSNISVSPKSLGWWLDGVKFCDKVSHSIVSMLQNCVDKALDSVTMRYYRVTEKMWKGPRATWQEIRVSSY